MKIVTLLLLLGLTFSGIYGVQAASLTTEFHALNQSITADKVQNIICPNGVIISGFVKNQNGQPVKGAFVSAELQQANVAAVGATTTPTGAFSIAVQPGTYTFFVTPPRSASVSPSAFSRLLRGKLENINVTGAMNVGTITLNNGFILSGKISSAAGPLGIFGGVLWTFPVPGGTIGFQAAQLGAPPASSTQYATALAPGNYKGVLIPFLAFSTSFQQQPVTFTTAQFSINADKVLNLNLRKGAQLSGTVKDAAGTPMSGFVWIFQKAAPFEPTVYVGIGIVANGTYKVFLPPGNFNAIFVPFNQPGYVGRGATVTVPVTMPAGNKVLNITAKNGVILSGKITNAGGIAIKTGGIMLRGSTNDPWGPSQITFAAFASTNATGNYRVVVPSGTYDIVAFPNNKGVKTTGQDLFTAISAMEHSH